MSLDPENGECSINIHSSNESSPTVSTSPTVAEKQEGIQDCLSQKDYPITPEATIIYDNDNKVGKSMELESSEPKPFTFILHPNRIHTDSIEGITPDITDNRVTNREKEFGLEFDESVALLNKNAHMLLQDVPTSKVHGSVDDGCASRPKGDPQLQVSIVSLRQHDGGDDSDDEVLMTKSPKEILYDIAMGKWPKKTLVLDSESESTKKLDRRPCSNANCVREAERQKRKRQSFRFNMSKDSVEEVDDVLFEDENLPSYHSLLQIWHDRNFQWNSSIFKSGNPSSEEEFLNLWRACRRDPEAYGIKITPPTELTDSESPKPTCKSKPLKPKKSILKNNNPELEQLKSKECESMLKRIKELRYLYPHLPPTTGIEGRTKSKLQIRLKQAENWHRLMTYEPKEDLVRSTPDISSNLFVGEMDFNTPRYASSTKSFRRKIRNIVPNI